MLNPSEVSRPSEVSGSVASKLRKARHKVEDYKVSEGSSVTISYSDMEVLVNRSRKFTELVKKIAACYTDTSHMANIASPDGLMTELELVLEVSIDVQKLVEATKGYGYVNWVEDLKDFYNANAGNIYIDGLDFDNLSFDELFDSEYVVKKVENACSIDTTLLPF